MSQEQHIGNDVYLDWRLWPKKKNHSVTV